MVGRLVVVVRVDVEHVEPQVLVLVGPAEHADRWPTRLDAVLHDRPVLDHERDRPRLHRCCTLVRHVDLQPERPR